MTEEQVKELFRKYELGLCTPEEEAAINRWIDSKGYEQHSGWTEAEQTLFMNQLDERVGKITHSEDFPDQEDASNDRRTPFIRYLSGSKKWAVAAAVLIISTTTWLFLHNDPESEQKAATASRATSNDLLPGRRKATLTLADGSTILLDTTANGTIALQGNAAVIKSNEGQIQYTVATHNKQEIIYNTVSTPRGGQYQISLPDGTAVWLNAASSITYPTSFTGNERVVTLTGEAYFEVAVNKHQPFRVKTGAMVVQVLGTHFNINSYSDEGSVKTTLLEGSVKVMIKDTATNQDISSLILQPEQQAATATGSTKIKLIKEVDIDHVMAWKNGLFHFDNADLQTVMRHLARWYDVDVEYEGNISSLHFEGEIPMDALASQVLKVLEKNNVHFRIAGKKIIVSP